MKFRLAETYLLLAEAYLRQDMPDKAADAVNEVRRRAKVSDVSDEEMTMDFKLGSKSVNPWPLFQTSGGLFWKENG